MVGLRSSKLVQARAPWQVSAYSSAPPLCPPQRASYRQSGLPLRIEVLAVPFVVKGFSSLCIACFFFEVTL